MRKLDQDRSERRLFLKAVFPIPFSVPELLKLRPTLRRCQAGEVNLLPSNFTLLEHDLEWKLHSGLPAEHCAKNFMAGNDFLQGAVHLIRIYLAGERNQARRSRGTRQRLLLKFPGKFLLW